MKLRRQWLEKSLSKENFNVISGNNFEVSKWHIREQIKSNKIIDHIARNIN